MEFETSIKSISGRKIKAIKMKHLSKFNENIDYKYNNGIAIIDDIENEIIGFIVEPNDIEKKLYEVSLHFSDDVELDIPPSLKLFDSDIIINGKDLHHETAIRIKLKSVSMY